MCEGKKGKVPRSQSWKGSPSTTLVWEKNIEPEKEMMSYARGIFFEKKISKPSSGWGKESDRRGRS